jgi:hypothetical protein
MAFYLSSSRKSYRQIRLQKAAWRQTNRFLRHEYGDSASSPGEDVSFGTSVKLDRAMEDGVVF